MTALLTPEQKKGSRKFSSKKLKTLMASTAVAAAGIVMLAANPANALPGDPNVVGGTIGYDYSVPNQVTGTQTTQQSYTLWGTLDTGVGESFILNLPNADALSVHKVTGASDIDGTQFNGLLSSNGNVWILDANGVFFGANSVINVGGLLASTGDVSISDVMDGDGKFELSNFGDGSVVNNGTMTVAEGGLAALVAPHAANNGIINAKLGTVALAAGETVTIDMYGDGLYEIAVDGQLADALVENSGTITAEGGTVLMTANAAKNAVDNIINMDGVADVSSVTVSGGKIVLNGGSAGTVKVAGVLDASGGGANDGGEIDVIGEIVEVDGAGIFADGGVEGNGGDILFYGTEKAILNGYVTARGGSSSGNGGTVELSSPNSVEFADLLVDTTAANGEWGSFTIDPAIINIFHAPMIVDPAISAEVAAGFFRDGLLGLLLGFTDLVLAATEEVDVNHDIDISEGHLDFEWDNPNPLGDDIEIHIHQMATGNLTLLAPTVDINGNITIGTGNLNFVAETVDLGGTTFSRSTLGGGTSLVTDEARLGGLSNTINVGGSHDRIDQAINFMADFGSGKTINVAAGAYTGGLVLDKSGVALVGEPGAVLNNTPGGTGVRAEANDTEVSGFTVNGGAIGIHAKDADGFAANNNTFNNQTLAALNVSGLTTNVAALTGNIFDGAAPTYIRNSAANAEIDASNNTYNGLTNANYNPSLDANPLDLENLFELEDRTMHRADDAAFGLVTYVPGALFVTENTAGIQNAVNIADSGNSIYVQAGTYSESVDVNKTLNLYGANAGIDPNTGERVEETVVSPNSPGFHITAGGSIVDGFTVFGADDGVFIDDVSLVTVTNNIFVDSSANGVRVLNGIGNTISNNRIDGFDISGVNLFNSTLTNVTGNVMFNGGSNGIVIRGANGGNISGNDISDVTDNGIRISDSSGNLLIDSNIIDDADDNGVSVTGSNGIIVSNNTINVSEAGVSIDDSANVTVGGNTLNGNDDETGVKITDSEAITVVGNTIDDYETGVDASDSNDVMVSGNIITSVDYGVKADNVSVLNVISNIMTGNSITGVWVLNSDGANVNNNALFDFATGILIDNSDDVTVDGNSVTKLATGTTGILVTNDSDSALVTDNSVTNMDTAGISFANDSDNGTAAGNTVDGDGNTDNGIVTSANSGGTTIDSNTVYGTTAQGILANNDTASVSINTVYGTGGDAIEVNNSANVQVAGNRVGMDGAEVSQGTDNVGGEGIDVNNSAGADITGNKVMETVSNGISITGSANSTVSGNTVTNAGTFGILASTSNGADILSNAVNNGVHGIRVQTSTDVETSGNTVTNADETGIAYINNATGGLIVNNTVNGFSNTGVGIQTGTNSTGATIDSNTVYGTTAQGIIARNGTVSVSINTVFGTGDDAIEVNNSGNVSIMGNKVGMDSAEVAQGDNNVGNEGIDVNNSAGAQILNNKVTETVSNGISVNPSPNSLIAGNTVTAFGTNGIYVLGSDNVDVFGNTVDNDGTGTGIRVENSNGVEAGAGEGIGADSNIVSDVEYGVYVQGGDAIEVDNNDIDNATYGVYANGTSNVLIIDNLISTGLAGVTVSGGTNATVGGFGGDNFIDGYTTGVHMNTVGGFEVSYNTISNTGTTGVDVDAGTGGVVKNNAISGSTTVTGIDVADHDGIIVDANTLTGFDATNGINVGISIDSSFNAEVTNNVLTNMDVDGIRVFNGSDGTNVQGNTVNDTAQVAGSEAIWVDNSDSVTVLNNTVKRSFVGIGGFNSDNLTVDSNTGSIIRTGIKLDNVHTALVNLNNMIVTAAAPTETVGVDAKNSSNLTITNNTLEDFLTAGIRIVDSETALVDGNTVRDADFGIRANNVSNLVVTNNNLDGRVAPGKGAGSGIFVGFSEGAVIGTMGNGNTVTDFTGGIRVTDSAESLVEDNTVTSFTATGVRIINSGMTDVHSNAIDNAGATGVGISVETSNGSTVSENDIDNLGGNSIQIINSHDTFVSTNTLDNIGGNGIWIDPSDNAEVAFNVLNNVTLDGILVDLGLNAWIHDNTITATGGDGIGVNDNDGVRVENNTLNGATGNGIDVSLSDNANIEGNGITNGLSNGIKLTDSHDVTILTNTITTMNGNGIWVDPSDNTEVAGNIISDIGLNGILVDLGLNAYVHDNSVSTVAGNGIDVNGNTGARVETNTLTGITGNGIKLTDSNDVTILANTLDFIGGNGIWVDPSNNVEVAGNVVRDVTLDGILVDGGENVYVHNNRTVRTGDDGIDVNGNSGARIEDNRSFRAGDNGIEVDESFGAKVLRNLIGLVTGNGIKIDDSEDVEVDGNRVFLAGDDGIDADNALNITIANNRIRFTGDDGIDVTDSYGATISGNDVARTQDNGIRVEDSDYLKVEGNIVNRAGNDGIHVENGDWIRIGEGNIVTMAGNNGIDVDGSSDVKIYENTVTDSGNDGIQVSNVYGEGSSGWALRVLGNTVDTTGDDGIEVTDGGRTLIEGNIVSNAGEGGSEAVSIALDNDDYGADGIHVRNVGGGLKPTIAGIGYGEGYGSDDDYELVIRGNTVNVTSDDGIEVVYSGRTLIDTNTVTNAGAGGGVGYDGADGYGADGIHVRNVFGGSQQQIGTDGEGFYNYAVNIIGNTVDVTSDDGIEVIDSGATVISGNNVTHAGYGESSYYDGGDFWGADGIHVRNVFGSDGYSEGFDSGDGFQEYSVVIDGNTVNTTGDDGVQVILSGDTRIANNVIGNSGTPEGARLFGGDGIHVLAIGEFGYEGEGYTHVEIVGNDVSNSLDDGIDVLGANLNVLVDANHADQSGDNGVMLFNLGGFFEGGGESEGPSVELTGFNSEITGNTIENSGNFGLFVAGPGHDDVIVSGNVFTNNPVHAVFESGAIDLTGEGNVFNFGETALRFAPFQFGESEFFADMNLVGDTIGSQFFNGQSAFFVELANGAFFNPGTPTILDATDSTFVTPFGTVRPSDTNDLIGADVFAFLESRFFHFNDLSTLGLFFFGNILSPEIDQKDIFRQFGEFGPFTGNVQFTLNGLPFVDPAFALAALAPAAGGQSAEDLAGIEPAAGGSEGGGQQQGGGNKDVNCWSDAAGAAGAGGSVTYGFGSGLDEALADAAGCSSEGL